MSNDPNEGWNHRSQMAGPDDPGLKAVSANVNARRAGVAEPYHPSGDYSGENPEQEPDEAGAALDWEDGFDARHLPNGRYGDDGTKSNRERLLDGETL